MTKSTITREQLEEWVAQFDEDGGCDATDRQLEALIRQSLAAMDSEPAASVNCVTAEHRRVIEMLLTVCGAAFELADDSCQQDVDGEDCHVVPDYAFQKLSDALDEIENTLPTEDTDRPDVFLVWSAVPRAALKSILHAQQEPVVPLVPDFKKLARELVDNLVDCGGLDEGVKEKYLEWAEKTCRTAMLNGGKP